MNTLHRVFVYGTLKRGEPNHRLMINTENGYAKFLATAKTIQKYPLVIATKYNIPFLLKHPGIGNIVIGEIFEVDSKMLSRLDKLEDHPQFYVRTEEELSIEKTEHSMQNLENGETTTKAWVYFLPKFKPKLLEEVMYSSYSNNGNHGLKYGERYQREPSYDPRNDVCDSSLESYKTR